MLVGLGLLVTTQLEPSMPDSASNVTEAADADPRVISDAASHAMVDFIRDFQVDLVFMVQSEFFRSFSRLSSHHITSVGESFFDAKTGFLERPPYSAWTFTSQPASWVGIEVL